MFGTPIMWSRIGHVLGTYWRAHVTNSITFVAYQQNQGPDQISALMAYRCRILTYSEMVETWQTRQSQKDEQNQKERARSYAYTNMHAHIHTHTHTQTHTYTDRHTYMRTSLTSI